MSLFSSTSVPTQDLPNANITDKRSIACRDANLALIKSLFPPGNVNAQIEVKRC